MADQEKKQGENQGEGNWDAARAYDRDQKQFADSGKVEKAARDAAEALDGKEGDKLKEAERLGKRHAKAEDPSVKR